MDVLITQATLMQKAAFLQMLDDYDAHDPANGRYYGAARVDFAAYVQRLHDDERGLVGIVPCSHRWLVNGEGALAGVVRVRHRLDSEFLAAEIGHIGYDVPPAQRRRGFGVAALQAGLAHARELGLTHVVLYADTDNPASWRTIERCGGILDEERHSPHFDCLVRRYLIAIAPFARSEN